jgi:hypothetical protein
MKKIYVLIIFTILIFSCNKEETPNLNYYGEATKAQGLYLYLDNTVETNIINDNGKIVNHYDYNMKGNLTYSETLNNENIKSCNIQIRFPYVIKYQNKFYAFGWKHPEQYNIYMWESNDGINWNNCKLVLSKSNDPNSIWYYIWNVGVTIDKNGICHLLAECAPKGENQNGVGLSYLTCTFDENINFDNSKTESQIIPGGGNPYLYYSEEKNSILVIHGMIYTNYKNFTADYWFTTASTFNIDKNEWNTNFDKFSFGEKNIHVCDPHAININNNIFIVFSWDQDTTYGFFIKGNLEDLI